MLRSGAPGGRPPLKRRISLAALMVAALIPPLVMYLAAQVIEMHRRQFTAGEISLMLAQSLTFGTGAAIAAYLVRRSRM